MSSEAFYVEASKHLEAVFEDRSYVGLQAILLCCYYSLLNPTRGSKYSVPRVSLCRDLQNLAASQVFGTSSALLLDVLWITVFITRLKLQRTCPRSKLTCAAGCSTPCTISTDCCAIRSEGRTAFPMTSLLFLYVFLPGSRSRHRLNLASLQPFSDLPDSAITDQGLLSAEPDPYKVVALNFIPLRELQSEINSRLYSVKAVEQPSQEWFDSMFERLKVWLSNSPEPKGCTSAEGYAISFHSKPHVERQVRFTLMFRLFRVDTVLLLFRPSPACPRPSKDALAACLSSSSYIIRIFRTIQRKNKINWMWLSVSVPVQKCDITSSCNVPTQSHYVFMAGITYLYGLWNMNMLGDSPVTMMDAHLDVQACLGTLEALSGVYFKTSVRRGAYLISLLPSVCSVSSSLSIDFRNAQHSHHQAIIRGAKRDKRIGLETSQGRRLPICRWFGVCRCTRGIRHAPFLPVARLAITVAQNGTADGTAFTRQPLPQPSGPASESLGIDNGEDWVFKCRIL